MNALPKGIRKSEDAVAETIENNVRRLILNESPVDPAYYDKMSKLLDALIEQRRKGVVSYREYLERIATLTKEATMPGSGPGGSAAINTAGKRALYNNLREDEKLVLLVDKAVQESRQDGWRSNAMKTRRVRNAIKAVLEQAFLDAQAEGFTGTREGAAEYSAEAEATRILELVKHQNEY